MPPPPQVPFPKTTEHLKYVLSVIIFVFSLGIGYQRLESKLDAKQTAIEATVEAKLKTLEEKSTLERGYIQRELQEIKAQLSEIQVYLRDKK